MNITEFIADLRRRDIRLIAEGERLRVNAPKGTLTGPLREQIAGRKAEILGFLRESAANFALPPIRRVAKDQTSPLSFAQERLWFLEQLEPGGAVYNICRAVSLAGPLEVKALESSLREVLRRHQVLRAIFGAVGGRTVQMTAPVLKLSIPVIDVRQLLQSEPKGEVARLISEEARLPFNLSAGPLLRATLLRLGDDHHILILTIHHIVSDAWSMGILQREIAALYESFCHGKSASLPELPVQYVDYAAWQREWLQGEILEAQLSYWKQRLENLAPVNLATDRPRPMRHTYRGARKSIVVSQSLTAKLKELGEQAGATLFMTLVAAFKTLLYRYTGQEDVALGSPVASRNRAEIQGLIGFFVNTLVLRTDLSGTLTFRDLLGRVRETCLGAYANQDLPFEKLVEELRPERDLSRNPLFQVMFALQNAPQSLPKLGDLTWTRIDVDSGTSKFDLSLALADRDSQLSGFFEYSADLFDDSTIERMIGHLQTLLESIVNDPDQPISTLPLLTQAEQHQLLVEWNNTETVYPKDSCVHELFEAQVERVPDAIAIEFEAEHLSYRELNIRANRLAHYLRGLGVGPEKLVGICVERSLEMVVGLLGILKAGGAYLPLDLSYPGERSAFMLEDAQVSVLLTQEHLTENRRWWMDDTDSRSSVPSTLLSTGLDPRLKVVCMDRDWKEIASESEKNPTSSAAAENLAYVIYTSGSTGKPKGVAVEHRNAVNLIEWGGRAFTTEDLRGVLASTSVCFDLSVFEIFVPLSFGGKVILAENALCVHDSPHRNDISLINTVPSVMAELIAINALPESVRTVNLAGEVLRPELVGQIYDRGNVTKVYDLYGPSESTTYSTFTLRAPNQPATIGRPVANSRIYILDDTLEPLPVGVTGEIFIGGAGVARGYLHRPGLTAEKFIPEPFEPGRGGRLYMTGDRGRYLQDGNVEFMGRADNQVKIRGHRIELGEIEAVLKQHPLMRDGVVAARDRAWSAAEKALVAYVVPKHKTAPWIGELRKFLAAKLPGYMIPSAFVMLETLPLAPNGKVDRLRLPRSSDSPSDLSQPRVAPRSEIEELVAQVWRGVLQIAELSVDDNFFELGGHSLLAVRIVSGLREVFHKGFPLRILFDAPTVASLGAEIERLLRQPDLPELPPITPAPHHGPLPLSVNQEHLWHLEQMIPGKHFFNMPYVYQIRGELNIEALERALNAIVRRHEALRTVFDESEGLPSQRIQRSSELQLAVTDLRKLPQARKQKRAAVITLKESAQPFNLRRGPLMRTKLLRLTDEDYLFLVTMHHMISDRWSMQVFRHELLVLYETIFLNSENTLPHLSAGFVDFVFSERQAILSGRLNSQLDYWRKKLAARVPALILHKASAGRASQGLDMLRRPFKFSEAQFNQLKAIAAREHCTRFMVLLAGLNLMLHSLTGHSDIRVGTHVANRQRIEFQGLIGHFVNTVILQASILPGATLRQFLGEVRADCVLAHANQEVPFERIAATLENEQQIARECLCQVFLDYQTSALEPPVAPGFTLTPLDLQHPQIHARATLTTFDLILNFRESSTMLSGHMEHKAYLGRRLGSRMMTTLRQMLDALFFKPEEEIGIIMARASMRPRF